MIAGACRVVAVAIIVAGVVDPAWTAAHAVTPPIAVIEGAATQGLTDRVVNALKTQYRVERVVTPDTAAVVVAGRDLPAFAETMTMPAFAVTPAGPDVRIVALDAPPRGHVRARVPIDVRVRVWQARGRSIAIALAANGVTVDSATRPVGSDDETIAVPLTLTPSSTGVVPVRVTATITGDGTRVAHADTLVRVDDRPWTVLVFDRRPSWMSTFVRRAVESDSRFSVTSRTSTSTGVATDTPGAPATLNDAAALSKFDAIVIGAPDALTPLDVASLDIFLRRRGGSVVLLWDAPPTGAAAALGGVTKWTNDTLAADASIDTPYGALRASELARPTMASGLMPVVAIGALAEASPDPHVSPGVRVISPALLWSAPVGAGRVVVSGVLDSWRYRSAPNTAFDRVWTSIVGDAADQAPAPIGVSLDTRVVRPGARVGVTIRSRDAAGEYVDSAIPPVRVSARVTGGQGQAATAVRVWPGDTPGLYRASVTAPDAPGDVHVVASIAPDRPGAAAIDADADLRVATDAAPAGGDLAIAAWTSSRGGGVFDDSHPDGLSAALHRTLTTAAVVETTHPMRSPWWILPVTLLTGADWWTRRRRGLR